MLKFIKEWGIIVIIGSVLGFSFGYIMLSWCNTSNVVYVKE
jgi:hypothetical protein